MRTMLETVLAVVFAGAAVAKLFAYDGFLRSLTSLPWLGVTAARRLTRAVPAIELIAAALLLALPAAGAVVSLATLAVFSGVVLGELLAGRTFDCGCFGGTGAGISGAATIVRNTCLVMAAVGVLLLPPEVAQTAALLAGAGIGLLFLLAEVSAETIRAGVHA